MQTKRRLFIFAISSLILLSVVFFFSLFFGAEKIPLSAFLGKASHFQKIIIWQLRLPRSLLVLLTGILLGGTVAVFQLFFRNELAEPGIIGISSGATLGAVIASCAGLGTLTTSTSFFLLRLISLVNLFAF